MKNLLDYSDRLALYGLVTVVAFFSLLRVMEIFL